MIKLHGDLYRFRFDKTILYSYSFRFCFEHAHIPLLYNSLDIELEQTFIDRDLHIA